MPNDTTQSELESWFTQYGGRPGGFWTFKSADDNNNNNNNNSNGGKGYQNARKYGISGFVAFNTHEEAVDCLALNGRVLNDRPIEVQASSSKVFDMAMDKLLLTLFPLSKNRPRPGDWTCLSCGFSISREEHTVSGALLRQWRFRMFLTVIQAMPTVMAMLAATTTTTTIVELAVA